MPAHNDHCSNIGSPPQGIYEMTLVKTIIREAVVGHKGTASQKSKSLRFIQ